MKIELNIEDAMKAYNWFHHAYPTYKDNKWCSPQSIMLRNRLERFLIASGK